MQRDGHELFKVWGGLGTVLETLCGGGLELGVGDVSGQETLGVSGALSFQLAF